jgi:hypothetical protein
VWSMWHVVGTKIHVSLQTAEGKRGSTWDTLASMGMT